MLRNQNDVNQKIIQYIDDNQVENLKQLIDENSSILDERRLYFSNGGETCKDPMTIAEYALLKLKSVDMLKYILGVMSDDKLSSFLNAELYYTTKNNSILHTRALHLFAIFYHDECTRIILEKLSQPPFDLDSLLMKKSSYENTPLLLAYRNQPGRLLVWTQYLNASKQKNSIFCLKDNTQCSILNYAIHRQSNEDVVTILSALDDQAAVDLIQSKLRDGHTGLHQAMHGNKLTEKTILFMFEKLANNKSNRQSLLALLFKSEDNTVLSIFDFAIRYSYHEVTQLCLRQINFDDIEEVKTYLQDKKDQIKQDGARYMSIHSGLSLQGLLNLYLVVMDPRIKNEFIKKLTSTTHDISTLNKISQMLLTNLTNLKELINDLDFQKRIDLFPDNGFFISTLLATKGKEIVTQYKKYESWCYRKMMLDVVSGLKAKEWKLDETSEKELNQILNDTKNAHKGGILQTILTLFGSHPDRVKGFQALNKDKRTAVTDYPEICYLLAICHQHAIGISLNDEMAIQSYSEAYRVICDQIKNNSKDITGLIAYLNHFKQKIIQDLKAYFESQMSDDAKYLVAVAYSDIVLSEKDREKAEEFLALLNTIQPERYHAIKAKLYYELRNQNKDYLEKSASLMYGPALKETADELISHVPLPLESVAHFYYQAITTSVMPQVETGIDGMITCLKQKGTLDRLKPAENLVTFIDQKVNSTDKYWKKYQAFLEAMRSQYAYLPAHWALCKKQDVSNKKCEFHYSLILVALGEEPTINNFIPKNSDASSAKQHAETAVRDYLKDETGTFLPSFYVACALLETSPDKRRDQAKEAALREKEIAISTLNSVKNSAHSTSLQKTCDELLVYLKDPKLKLEGPNTINNSMPNQSNPSASVMSNPNNNVTDNPPMVPASVLPLNTKDSWYTGALHDIPPSSNENPTPPSLSESGPENDSKPLYNWEFVIGQMKGEISAQKFQMEKQLVEHRLNLNNLSRNLDTANAKLKATKSELENKISALEKVTEEQVAVKEENKALKKEMAEVKEENDQLKEEIGHLREDLRFSGRSLAVSRRVETWKNHFSIYAPTKNEVKNNTNKVNESDNNETKTPIKKPA